MATVRERKPGIWEVRAFTGRDASGKPTQVSRTVRGTKKDALLVAAELTVAPASKASGRTVSEMLDAWVAKHETTWAPASQRDQTSRVTRIRADRIARLSVARLSIEDVERWHGRLRSDGLSDTSIRNLHGVLRAAFTKAVRWGWVSRNVVSMAELDARKVAPRGVMSAAEVRAVIVAGDSLGSEVGLMLRLAAVTGARRAELAALRWDEVIEGVLTIDSSIEVDRRAPGGSVLSDSATKTANQRQSHWMRRRWPLLRGSVRPGRSSGRGCLMWVMVRRTRTGSGTGGALLVTPRASTQSGACMICATGQHRRRSRQGTT